MTGTSPTNGTENDSTNPFAETTEMITLNTAVRLMISDRNSASYISIAVLNPENFPAAMLHVLYGKSGSSDTEITPGLVAAALLRMGASRYDIFGSVFTAIGQPGRLEELTALANNRQQQRDADATVVSPADALEQLKLVVGAVLTEDELERFNAGMALTLMVPLLATLLKPLPMHLFNHPATDLPPVV